jgi:ribosomal protein S18 acetylase RimI-like enzyme
VTDDLRRAFALIAAGDMGGARRAAATFGVAVYDEQLPLRFDSNYLLVDALPESVSADDVATEARLLSRLAIMVRDESTGQRLLPRFEQLGWRVHRGLVMAHRRAPERTVHNVPVDEVDDAALRIARRERLDGEPWATPDVIGQLLQAKEAVARAVRARFFAVRVGSAVVSYGDLYLDGGVAQIEDVATLDGYRGRGYATAVVLRALEEAGAAGCDLTFLVTDEDDWPKEWYARLGFETLGKYRKFVDTSR